MGIISSEVRGILMNVKIFDNINDIVRDDMISTINKGSKISIAAACFSIYAYKELKEQLEQIDECRFLQHQHLLKKKQKNRSENSIFLD